jgi:hypothetical protein
LKHPIPNLIWLIKNSGSNIFAKVICIQQSLRATVILEFIAIAHQRSSEAASDRQRIALIDCQFALSTLYLAVHYIASTSVHRHNQTTIFRNENELKSIQLELY